MEQADQSVRTRARALLVATARQPLVQFAALGALLFTLHTSLRGARRESPSATRNESLVLDAHRRGELTALFRQRQGRDPSAAEFEQLVARWAEDEALFRKALRDELVERDPVLREQLIARMRVLLQDALPTRFPSDAELRDYYAAHKSRYTVPARYDFIEYLVPSGARADDEARELLRALQRGEAGTRASVVHSQRPESELRSLYGEQLTQQLANVPLSSWIVLRSARALHVVLVQARSPAGKPSFDAIKPQLSVDWTAEQRRENFQRQLRQLTAQWPVQAERG